MKDDSRFVHRRRMRRRVLGVVVALLLAAVLDYNLYPLLSRAGGVSLNRGENGLWLRYTWYFGRWDERSLGNLASKLNENEIRYAYFHVRSIKEDGTLKFRYARNSQHLTTALHKAAPSTRLLAWVYAGNTSALGRVDLRKHAVRTAIVGECLWLVTVCGFDGVQMDYEICPDGDDGFFQLMKDLRKVLPKGKMLSIATPMWVPGPVLAVTGWSSEYFSKIAPYCDQVCVMSYDSATYFPRIYVWLVRKQVINVSRAVAAGNAQCEVIFGLPTYEDGPKSHNPHSENIKLALKGVREGLADPRTAKRACAGVAIFADYTTSASEWETYQALWLQIAPLSRKR